MKRIQAVLMVYRERSFFSILVLALVVVMLVGKIFFLSHQWILLEELFTVWLCIWMPLAFQSGIMIKRQIASPMAGLIPRYRAAHIATGSFLWLAVAFLTAWWLSGLTDLISVRAKTAWIILCLGTYLMTLVIAYISERMILLTGYAILIFIVAHTQGLVHFLVISDMALYGLITAGVVLFSVFVWRLAKLKEGMAEYSYILSWPLHRSGARASAHPYAYEKITPYARKKGLLNRAFHWAYVEHEDVVGAGGIFLVAAGAFMAYVLFWGGPSGFYARPYANFLVFTGVPILMMLCFYYRVVAYRDHALLRPVRREELAAQWGALLAVSLLGAWILIATLFGIVPVLLLGLPLIHTLKFWLYLLLTGVFVQMTLAWLTYAATWKDPWVVVMHVVVYGVVMMFEFWSVPALGTRMMLMHILGTAMAAVIFAVLSYRRWCCEEV